MDKHFLAVDLGAESGRVMMGTVADGRGDPRIAPTIGVEEIHRFANTPVSAGESLRWDVDRLFHEIKTGLRMAADQGVEIAGVSTDAWGLDYVRLSAGVTHGTPLPTTEMPFHYRDARTDGVMEKVLEEIPAQEIFEATGIQFMSINTLYQLVSEAHTLPGVLEGAVPFLNIGDYFNYRLSGNPRGEISVASTTQLFDARKREWAWALIEKLKLPKKIFPALVPPGTVMGPLLPEIAKETNLDNVQVIASCTHDTAAAVAATPGQGDDWAFLSSGTWSLLGAELPAPVISAASLKFNFTNEAGYDGTILFRKNIVGLWIVQECKRAWEAGGKNFDYGELTRLAESAPPLVSFIQPADARFGKAGKMPEKIAAYCRETNQPVPENPGAMIRCVLESLALLYAKTLRQCADACGKNFRVLHIVGGGSKNKLLNQLTANAVQLPVLAGPVEATAIGNILIQARTLGHLGGDLRACVRNSFQLEKFSALKSEAWDQARQRFETLTVPA